MGWGIRTGFLDLCGRLGDFFLHEKVRISQWKSWSMSGLDALTRETPFLKVMITPSEHE